MKTFFSIVPLFVSGAFLQLGVMNTYAHPEAISLLGSVLKVDSSGVDSLALSDTSGPPPRVALSAENFTVKPNPFSPRDAWGLQFAYTLHSKVSNQVSVKVLVQNQSGDPVYESQETLVKQDFKVKAGEFKSAPSATDRRSRLGPYVWDGRNNQGEYCRNGSYLLRFQIRDGQGLREYQRKVVLIQ